MKTLLCCLSAILIAPLLSGDFFNSPDEMKAIWQRSIEFYRRDAAKEAELRELNSQWTIQKVWPAEGTQTIYTSAIDDNGNVFFVTADNFDYQVCQLTADGGVKSRWTFPKLRDVGNGDRLGYYFKMKIDGETLLLTEGRYVWISHPGRKLLHRMANFPFVINDLWLQNNRVMLLGEKQLMSCDCFGETRETHFAANQIEKTLPLFQTNPQATFLAGGMGQNNDEAILFYGESPSALGKYSLAKNEFTQIATLPMVREQGYFFNVVRRKDIYLYSCAAAPGCIWQIQLAYLVAENRMTMLGYRDADFLKHFWKDMPSEQGVAWLPGHNIAGNLEYNGNFLLYSGGSIRGQRENTPACAGVVDMKHYPSGRALKYPAVNGLYFHPDGKSLWAVEFNEITRITPAEVI